MMDIFISWSGDRGKYIALKLRDWVPSVLQGVKPWVSDQDIQKGARWVTELLNHLDSCQVGIVCLTPESLQAPFLLFESGALAKNVDSSFLIPYLWGLKPTDVTGPLSLFQGVQADEQGTKQALETINLLLGENGLPEGRFNETFQKWWPDMADHLSQVPVPEEPVNRQTRPEGEVQEELLTLMRGVDQRLNADFSAGQWPPWGAGFDPTSVLGTSRRRSPQFSIPDSNRGFRYRFAFETEEQAKSFADNLSRSSPAFIEYEIYQTATGGRWGVNADFTHVIPNSIILYVGQQSGYSFNLTDNFIDLLNI